MDGGSKKARLTGPKDYPSGRSGRQSGKNGYCRPREGDEKESYARVGRVGNEL